MGRTWDEPVRIAPVRNGTTRWGVIATSSDGAVHTLVRTDDASAPAWTMSFDALAIDGSVAAIPLARGDRLPNGGGAGDDYGGLAVAPDGTVWAAFSDPREGTHERIAVVRLSAT